MNDFHTLATTKQFGDACEHYVIAMLGFANVPATKMPDGWPGYDVLAQPVGEPPQRINVKGRRWPNSGRAFRLQANGPWEWVAAVVIETATIRCWLLPRNEALRLSTVMPMDGERRLNLSTLFTQCGQWEGNFAIGGLT